MKIRNILFAALLMAAHTAFAGVKWLETERDFGAFDEDLGPVECSFRFVNTYFEPMSIVAARASCGCTTPKYPREAIAPGDTAVITVTYDPAGRPGRFSKYVAVSLSDGEPQVKLFLKGTVVGSERSVSARFPVDCGNELRLARGVLMTGEVTKGQMRTVFLEAYNRSTDTIRPRVDRVPPYFEIVPSPDAVPPGEQMSFICYFRSAKCPDYGIVCDTMAIWPDASASEPCLIPTVALVREDFSHLSPKELAKAPHIGLPESSVDFGRLGSEVVSRSFTIKNTGKSQLKIRRVYTGDPGISLAVDRTALKPGKEAVVRVTVDPAALKGALLNARIAVISNDPDKPEASVRVVGER